MRKQASRTANQGEMDGKRLHFGSPLVARRRSTDVFKHGAEPFLARFTQQRTPVGERLYFNTDPWEE